MQDTSCRVLYIHAGPLWHIHTGALFRCHWHTLPNHTAGIVSWLVSYILSAAATKDSPVAYATYYTMHCLWHCTQSNMKNPTPIQPNKTVLQSRVTIKP
eukprot:jgi/Chrzof1/11468/Cz05g37210.t1